MTYNVILYLMYVHSFYPLTFLTIFVIKKTNMWNNYLPAIVQDTDLKSDNVYDFPCNKTPYECDTDNVTHDEEDDETPVEGIVKVARSGPITIVVEENVNDNKLQFNIIFVLFNTIG